MITLESLGLSLEDVLGGSKGKGKGTCIPPVSPERVNPWRPTAWVMLIRQWSCACGAAGVTPASIGWLLEERREMPDGSMAVHLSTPLPDKAIPAGLPREIRVESKSYHTACPACAEKENDHD